MASRLNPYLNFRGTAREAMTFYQSVFGGDLDVNTFGDLGAGDQFPDERDNVMHSQLVTPAGFTLMGADVPAAMDFTPGNNVHVSLSGDDDAELRGYWDKLSGDGTVTMPLEKAPWGDSFGACTDRFGTSWLVNITGADG